MFAPPGAMGQTVPCGAGECCTAPPPREKPISHTHTHTHTHTQSPVVQESVPPGQHRPQRDPQPPRPYCNPGERGQLRDLGLCLPAGGQLRGAAGDPPGATGYTYLTQIYPSWLQQSLLLSPIAVQPEAGAKARSWLGAAGLQQRQLPGVGLAGFAGQREAYGAHAQATRSRGVAVLLSCIQLSPAPLQHGITPYRDTTSFQPWACVPSVRRAKSRVVPFYLDSAARARSRQTQTRRWAFTAPC